MDREALSDFLTRRREALQPADVGLLSGPRRRVAGLRREEVAQLAAMSTDYYTRLEQKRGPQPSTQMLSSLARALRLTEQERDYLYRVGGHSAPDHVGGGDHVAPGLLRLLDRFSDTPALIISSLEETLAQNDLARALFGDERHLTGLDRSMIYRWFAYPETARSHYPTSDHERQSRAAVSSLRVAYAAMGADSRAGEIVRRLRRDSPEFVELWQRHEVSRRFADHKTLIHPQVGDIEVDCQALFTEDQSQGLLILTAAPRSEAEGKLKLLAVVGTQQFSEQP